MQQGGRELFLHPTPTLLRGSYPLTILPNRDYRTLDLVRKDIS